MATRGWEGYQPQESGRVPSPPTGGTGAKRPKYGAVKTVVLGITFDSKREADRFEELLLLQKAGDITGLELQPQYPLHVMTPSGTRVVIGRYIADFRYTRNGEVVIEDAKGFRGKELYLWKLKHVVAQYGIVVKEV